MTFACNLTLERSNINSPCHPKENFLDKISLGSKINLTFCNFEMPTPPSGFFFFRTSMDGPGTVEDEGVEPGDPEGRRLQLRHHPSGNRRQNSAIRSI